MDYSQDKTEENKIFVTYYDHTEINNKTKLIKEANQDIGHGNPLAAYKFIKINFISQT